MMKIKMNRMGYAVFGVMVLASMGLAGAHLKSGSLIPNGSVTLKPADVFNITWTVNTAHPGGTDIAFSKDGTTWTTIKSKFMDGLGSNTFAWTVPNDITDTGRIRICQLGGSSGCTDANNSSNPATNAPYVLVSSNFMISAATGILPNSTDNNSLSLKANQNASAIEINFSVISNGSVKLLAYNLQGKLIATFGPQLIFPFPFQLRCLSSPRRGQHLLMFEQFLWNKYLLS